MKKWLIATGYLCLHEWIEITVAREHQTKKIV